MSKGPTAMATSKTKQRGPGAGTTSKKRGKKPAPSAASEAIVSAMMLDDSCHGEERDASSDPRDGGGEGRDSCDVMLSGGRNPGRSNGAGVKKKLKAKAAAAAAASFDADEVLNPSAAHPANPAPSSSALHPSFGCVHAAAVMMQADMNLNDASEMPRETGHSTLVPAPLVCGNQTRERLDQTGPILTDDRQHQYPCHSSVPFYVVFSP